MNLSWSSPLFLCKLKSTFNSFFNVCLEIHKGTCIQSIIVWNWDHSDGNKITFATLLSTKGGWPSADALKYHGQMARAYEAACYVMLSATRLTLPPSLQVLIFDSELRSIAVLNLNFVVVVVFFGIHVSELGFLIPQ